MTPAATITAACVLAVGSMFAARADAAEPLRQYYTGWKHHAERGYWYRTYHYKPQAGYVGYRHQYCIFYRSQPRYVFFFDPYEKAYWGRFDTKGESGRQFSILPESERRERLTDVPRAAFAEEGEMPAIPQADDGVLIEPPDGLPPFRSQD